ncbi:TlpA disulfide reductase family protein [Amphritea sp. HPY]|uniref:TlpA disulfide reductase family protein n=1 Tax=Amphritea sp. HPY TaxID=3421652 RepID=UPI003D7DC4A5
MILSLYTLPRFKASTAIAALFSIILCSFSLQVKATESVYDQLQVTDLEGNIVDLNAYQGKVVLLNFWATWCPPCIKEMPSMQSLQNRFSEDRFQVIAVNMGQTPTTVESFLLEREFEFSLPVYLDEKGVAFRALNIAGMPSSFLLDAKGNILEKIVGAREWDHPDNVAALKNLLSDQQAE